jgi:hypothetical protein
MDQIKVVAGKKKELYVQKYDFIKIDIFRNKKKLGISLF